MQKLKIKRSFYSYNSIIDIFLILLVGLLSITWFRGNFLIYHGDQCLPLLPIKDFQNFNYSWNHLMVTGFPNPPGFANFFYLGFFALMEFLGFSLVASEKIFYYFLFTASGLSMYYLTTILISKDSRRIIGLASTLFYMFNFFPLSMFWPAFSTLAIFYALIPFILALYIQMLKAKMGNKSYVVMLFSIAVLGWTVMSPTYIMCFVLIFFLYSIYFILENYKDKKAIKVVFSSNILLVFFYFLLNIWWLMPVFFGSKTFSVAAGVDAPEKSLGAFSMWSTSFLHLFRLLTPWTFNISYGDFFFPWAWVYSTIPFLILGFIPPILAFIPFLSKQKNRAIFYFGPLFLLGLFLMKGMYPPLGQINKWLFLNTPFFVFFRNPYEKFGPIVVLSYTVLVGIGFNVLYVSLKKYSKNLAKIIIGLFFFLIFVVYMWPFWTGDLIYAGGRIKPSARVRIPEHYYEAKEWLSQQREEFKILSLPHQEGASYDWKHGYVGSDDPTIRLFQRPILGTIPYDKIIGSYLSNLPGLFTKPRRPKNIARFLGLTNIKYVLLHKDINYYINTPNRKVKAEDIKSILNSQEGIHLERSFDKLGFYKISDRYFLPHIYPTTPILVRGGIDDLPPLVTLDDFQTKNGILLSKLLKDSQKNFILNKSNEILVTNTPVIVKSRGKKFVLDRVDRWVIPKEGEYEVLVKIENGLRSKDLNAFSVKIDGASIVSSAPIFRPDGWISLGDFSFKKGAHRLSLYAVDKESKQTLIKGAYIVLRRSKPANNLLPLISFKKVNPTKYVVKVQNARNPFFLVFSESFHSGWKAFVDQRTGSRGGLDEIIAEYPKLQVKEARHQTKFTPGDVSYLFNKPINEDKHFLVNGYANAWYIDPKKIGKEDFAVTLFFWPQSLFCLGLGISLITLMGCIVYLMIPLIMRIVKHRES